VTGNLSSTETREIKPFLTHPEVEFLHTGPRRDIFGLQRRGMRQILADLRRGKFELMLAGNTFFPYFNPRKSFFRNLANLTGKLARDPRLALGGWLAQADCPVHVVGLDFEDSPVIDNSRFHVLRRAVCYFKRDLPQNPCNAFLYTNAKTECNGNVLHTSPFKEWMTKLRPVSLGIDDATAMKLAAIETEKKTDVFFAGDVQNRPNRLAGLRQLQQLVAEGYKIDLPTERLSREEFLLRCGQAFIVWSPEGFGWDCHRHYEIAAAGSVPLMQTPTILRYAPLLDGEHALYHWVEGDHLAERVRAALRDRARLVEMGRAARQHILQWHTHTALGHYIIKETKSALAGQ